MVIKLVLAQIQFVTVLMVASAVLLPFIAAAAVLLWWHQLFQVTWKTVMLGDALLHDDRSERCSKQHCIP